MDTGGPQLAESLDGGVVRGLVGGGAPALERIRVAGPLAGRVAGLAGQDDEPVGSVDATDWWPAVWPGVATMRTPGRTSWSPGVGRMSAPSKSTHSRIVWSVSWAKLHSTGWTRIGTFGNARFWPA